MRREIEAVRRCRLATKARRRPSRPRQHSGGAYHHTRVAEARPQQSLGKRTATDIALAHEDDVRAADFRRKPSNCDRARRRRRAAAPGNRRSIARLTARAMSHSSTRPGRASSCTRTSCTSFPIRMRYISTAHLARCQAVAIDPRRRASACLRRDMQIGQQSAAIYAGTIADGRPFLGRGQQTVPAIGKIDTQSDGQRH